MRKEIQEEVKFLQKWDTIFREKLLMDGHDDEAFQLGSTCIDAQRTLKGEAMRHHTDTSIIADLYALKGYIDRIARQGHFGSPSEYQRTLKMIDTIITMLSVTITQPASNTEVVQTSLF